jgi:hypothetical protein
MVNPLLTLLMAGSMPCPADLGLPDLPQVVVEIARAVEVAGSSAPPAQEALTVRDIPFYYDALAPVPVPGVELPPSYDWRSPVVFDLP